MIMVVKPFSRNPSGRICVPLHLFFCAYSSPKPLGRVTRSGRMEPCGSHCSGLLEWPYLAARRSIACLRKASSTSSKKFSER